MRIATMLLFGVLACDASESVFGVSTPGLPARVELHRNVESNGRVMETLIMIDSARATWFTVECEGETMSPCSSVEANDGVVEASFLHRLFAVAQAPEFRELESREGARGGPRVGTWSRLTVVTGERTKILRWDVQDSPPQALLDYVCLVLAASETHPLCD